MAGHGATVPVHVGKEDVVTSAQMAGMVMLLLLDAVFRSSGAGLGF